MNPIEPGITRSEALARARGRLRKAIPAAALPEPETEAEWLLLHALGVTRTSLRTEPGALLTSEEAARLERNLARRERREPIQLILGEVPFLDASIAVEPGVLIPRPETEALVDAVMTTLRRPGSASAAHAPYSGRFLDWGTGTGAIAIALLRAFPSCTGAGADRSARALQLARRNAAGNGVAERLTLLDADFQNPKTWPWLDPAFDLVVSNPPYVRRGDLAGLMPEVRDHDPAEALDGGADGLDAFRAIALGLPRWLRPNGLLALEIGADQADKVLGLFSGHIGDARVLPDWAGRPRIMIGTMRGERA